MKLLYFCPLWGSEEMEFETFCAQVVEAGYDGVETSLPLNDRPRTDAMIQTMGKYGLRLMAQHWETVATDLDEHLTEYRNRLEWLAAANPFRINSQTGRDWFGFEENNRIIDVANEIAQSTGTEILHETHRGKFSFCAATTARFLEHRPDLRITADFSHWCTVSESLLKDQQAFIDLAISRTNHFHARVGHPSGPQINDPRAPEWAEALKAHLGWWDAIVRTHRERGSEFLSITPEFGPYPYMQLLPYTQQPIANQWDINQYMLEFLRERFAPTEENQ